MGKAKKRIMGKYSANNGRILKREEIVKNIVFDIKNNSITEETKKNISLFGIKPEELSEAGASIEEITILKPFF